MKKHLALILLGLVALSGSALADVTLIFNDNGGGGGTATTGSYAPGSTFSFDISLVYTGAPPSDLFGYSLWFQSLQGGSFAGNLFSITAFNRTGSLFTDVQSASYPQPLNTSITGADNNFDLGASQPTGSTPQSMGTYFLGTISFQIGAGVAPGTYTLQNVFAPTGQPDAGHGSVAFNQAGAGSGGGVDIPSSQYMVTVIPEPTTWSLMAVATAGVAGLSYLRRRRVS